MMAFFRFLLRVVCNPIAALAGVKKNIKKQTQKLSSGRWALWFARPVASKTPALPNG